LEEKDPQNYDKILEFLGLKDADKTLASQEVEKARKIIVRIRKDRKILIKKFV
jgi:hypothetical protein